MKSKELKLSQDLVALQSQYNEMCHIKDIWKDRFRQEQIEAQKLASEVARLASLLSANSIDF